MRLFTFLVLEALLSPITLTGYAFLLAWAIAVSQQQSTSVTALGPLFGRWLLHLQGNCPDPIADSFMKTLPSLNLAFNWVSIGPTLFALNFSGYTPDLFKTAPPGKENLTNLFNARTLFFDRALESALETVEQVVILGAGFDTRLFKFCTGKGLSLFEVDQPSIQQVKIQALKKSGVDVSEIHFVAVNFNQEDWVEKLENSGFVRGKKTFFLWEGVTYYLTDAVIKRSLQAMGKICGESSAIAFDFFSQRFIKGNDTWWIQFGVTMLDWIGEPFRFGIDLESSDEGALTELVQGTGFQLGTLQLAGSTQHHRAFGGFATVVKTPEKMSDKTLGKATEPSDRAK